MKTKTSKPNEKKKPCLVYITCTKCKHRNGPFKPAALLRSRSSDAIKKAALANGKKGGRPRKDGMPPGSVVAVVVGLFLLLASMTGVRAEDWTVAGKEYHNVKVTSVEADRVHITYDGGLGAPLLQDLPPDLQHRFNYDPIKAKLEIANREKTMAAEQAYLATRYPSTPKPSVDVTVPAPAPVTVHLGPTAEERRMMQSQIASLQADIAQRQKEVDKNAGAELRHQITSQNGIREIIAKEQAQIMVLQGQLK